MASERNGLSWFGNIFNDSETDDKLIEEPIKYLSEKLTIAGDSFLQFCSDIADVLPTSIFSSAEQTLSKEEETKSLPVHEMSNNVNIDHEEILADSLSEQTANEDDARADFSISDHSSERAALEEFLSKYLSPVDQTKYPPVIEEIVSNDVHDEKLVDSLSDKFIAKETLHSSETLIVENSKQNDNEVDVHALWPMLEQRAEEMILEEFLRECCLSKDETVRSGSARSTEAIHSSGHYCINHELQPPKKVEPDQFLSDSDSDAMNYELETPKELESDELMDLSDILAAYASLRLVSDCDDKEEDNEVTEPSYMQKLDESFIVVEAEESHSDSNQQKFFQATNMKTFKNDATPDEEESETYDEDFSDSDCDWEFV